jgi:GNAT superfamily N-acetyltransferase
VSTAPVEVAAFRELDHGGELLDRLHREILAVSFSADELDNVETMARGLRGDGGSQVLASVALGPDNSMLGGVVGEVYTREQVLLLAYLAVRPDLRGRGIGTALMKHVGPRWYANPAVRLAVAEVHDPRHFSDIGDEHPLTRLRFYERLGGRLLGVPFVQPALGPDRARIEGFLLLALHVDPRIEISSSGRSSLPSGLVSRFVRRYYEVSEGVHAPYDSQLAHLFGLIEEHPAIDLLPIAEYKRVPPFA